MTETEVRSLVGEDPEKKTATYSSVLVWEEGRTRGHHMDRRTWPGTVHGVAKEWDPTEHLNNKCVKQFNYYLEHLKPFKYHLKQSHGIELTFGLSPTNFTAAPAAAAAKLLQSCPTLCDPIDGSPPGSPVPGILQS
ncbi:hypothetical protein R6Z07F_007315 [Ovis aries]